MKLTTLFMMLSACLGLGGSFFLLIGIVKLKPKEILDLEPGSQPWYGLGPHIQYVCSLKSDSITGATLLFSAFSLQLIALNIPGDILVLNICAITSFILLIILFVAVRKLRYLLYIYYFNEVKKYRIRIEIEDFIKKIDKDKVQNTFNSFISNCNSVLGINKKQDETNSHFLARISDHVRYHLPSSFDLTALDKYS